jgi:hypothetical protein
MEARKKCFYGKKVVINLAALPPLNYKSLFKTANKCAILWGRSGKLMRVKSEGKRKNRKIEDM